jgi:glycosyltransferase involved in cell wall biosynthesis
MDILAHAGGVGDFDEEVRSLGSKIFHCAYDGRPLRFARDLEQVLRSEGPYDVVHSHSHFFSGWVLKVAHRAGVPIRVAHSHLDSSRLDSRGGPGRRLKVALMRRWIDRHATIGLAASREAAAALFGPLWASDGRRRVLHCGIDLSPFESDRPDRRAVRSELGVHDDSFVVGHVGRFVEQKNHSFLIDVAVEVVRREPRSRLLLIGEGRLRGAVEEKARRLGVLDRVTFTGPRADVPRLMMGAMDAFVLPSLFEGLPVVGIEAQASGLGVLCSDTVTPELDVVPGLVRRLPLAAPAPAWAEALLRARESWSSLDPGAALRIVRRSTFNITNGIKALERLYTDVVAVAD